MKVGEMRQALQQYEKDYLIRIASELYKMIPKLKREDRGTALLIQSYDEWKSGSARSKAAKATDPSSLETADQLLYEVRDFHINARRRCAAGTRGA